MSQPKRGSKRNINADIQPHDPERIKALPRLWLGPTWDRALFSSKGQTWMGIRMDGSAILGDCFDCKKISPLPELSAPACDATINGVSSSFACRSGFRVSSVTNSSLGLEYDQVPEKRTRATFHLPSKVYEKVFVKKSIPCVDVRGDLGAAVCYEKSEKTSEKAVKIFDVETEEVKIDLQDQGETNVVKWMPHVSQKILAFSADNNVIKIYNVDKKKAVRTLRGHTGRVTQLVFVDSGRNLFSSSVDGVVRLWDVTRAEAMENVAINLGYPINSIDVQAADSSVESAFDPSLSSSTGPKVNRALIYGRSEDTLQIVALNSQKNIFSYRIEDPITCCRFLDHPYFACGTEWGQLICFDWRKPDVPLYRWREIRGTILCMTAYKEGIVCGTSDGSCFYRNPVVHENNDTAVEFCSAEYEPIWTVCCSGGNVYSSCKDGKIRRYSFAL